MEKVYIDEQQTSNTPDFEVIDTEQVQATIDKINSPLKDKKVKQKLNYFKKN